MRIKELFDLWLVKYTKLSVKVRTYNKYKDVINQRIIPEFGDYDIDKITTNMIQEFILKLLNKGNLVNDKPLSVNTIYGIISVLKQGFNLAISLDLINKNPTTSIKMPKASEKEICALTREEQKKVEEYCINNRKGNYIGIILCLYTGIRLGELLALTWNDIDFEKKILFIRKTTYKAKIAGKNEIIVDKPKTKKSKRVIPLPDKIINLLSYIKNQSESEYVISTNKHNIVDVRSYQRTFESILSRCHVKHYNFHCLRHTFATRALELGMDIKTLSEILGHTNVAITLNRYAHSLFEYKVQEMNKISSLL